jgi:hypothetical protein
MKSSRRYRVGISAFCPTIMVPTFGTPSCRALLIFLASARNTIGIEPTNFASKDSWLVGRQRDGQFLYHCDKIAFLGGIMKKTRNGIPRKTSRA